LQLALHAAEQHRKDVAQARRKWIREQGLLDPTRLIFIALSDQVKHFLAFLSQLSTFRPQLHAGQLWWWEWWLGVSWSGIGKAPLTRLSSAFATCS